MTRSLVFFFFISIFLSYCFLITIVGFVMFLEVLYYFFMLFVVAAVAIGFTSFEETTTQRQCDQCMQFLVTVEQNFCFFSYLHTNFALPHHVYTTNRHTHIHTNTKAQTLEWN